MTARIKVGIVGTKFAGRFHADALRRVGGVEIVGVYSKTPDSRAAFAREHGLRAFDTFDALAEASDVVDLCVPGAQHEPLCVRACELGRHVIVEKPFTGAYGSGAPEWRGDRADKRDLLEAAMQSVRRMVEAARRRQVTICYAENWVYAPPIRKAATIVRATQGQILWLHGEESHSGSTSAVYGDWSQSGGGSLVGKGCHPLSAALYLKRVEGQARLGRPLRPRTISCRTHAITRLPAFVDRGFLRADYKDIEDFAQAHVTFEDGTIADLFASELVMGGVHNWLEVYANNHRIRCNLNPNDANVLYNPDARQMEHVYLTEKLGTKQGWSFPAPDEHWIHGYPQELQDFMECLRDGREPESGVMLAADTVATLYAGYVSAQERGAETDIPLV